MPIPIRRIKRSYTVGSDFVELRVVVGDGQFGSTVIKLDGVEIASGILGMLKLGKGKDVRGSKLAVATTVTDVQRSSNRTSVTYELSGGPSTDVHLMDAEVENDGGSVLYIGRFALQ
jgi:hypothetical protein